MNSEITNKVDMFMQAEMPQIKMHGGDWEITNFDNGEINITLDGACSGCGISPMTVQAIRRRMPSTIDPIETVTVDINDETEDMTEGPFA